MKSKDILGQDMPILEVVGLSILPPPVFEIKEHMPYLVDFIRRAELGSLNKTHLDGLYEHIIALFSYNTHDSKISLRWLHKLSADDVFASVAEYIIFIKGTLPSLPYCAVPKVEDKDSDDSYSYERLTLPEKVVSDYANMPLPDVYQINYVDFLILQREAFIHNLSQTKKGREMLEEAYCSEQVTPDRTALRAALGGGENG